MCYGSSLSQISTIAWLLFLKYHNEYNVALPMEEMDCKVIGFVSSGSTPVIT